MSSKFYSSETTLADVEVGVCGFSGQHINKFFNTNNKVALLNDLQTVLKDKQNVFSILTRDQCVDIILQYDNVITNYCNQYYVPKSLVQAVLLRALWCIDNFDAYADAQVGLYFEWKQRCEDWNNLSIEQQIITPYPSASMPIREDFSAGIGQMSARAAIRAHNLAVEKGLIDSAPYDLNDWRDCREVWYKLRYNDTFAIKMVTLQICRCADYALAQECTEEEIKAILARYYGASDNSVTYVSECYRIFKKYS